MKSLLLEAVSKSSIIKSLNSDTFDVKRIIDDIENIAALNFHEKYSTVVPELVWIYVLKVLSLYKTFFNSLPYNHQIMLEKFIYDGQLYEISYIIKHNLPVEKEFIQKFLKIKHIDDLMAWIAKYNTLRDTKIEDAINFSLRKSKTVPIYSSKEFDIYHIKTYEEAKVVGQGTLWCVSSSGGREHMKKYIENKNVLYALILNETVPPIKFLLAIVEPEVMNLLKIFTSSDDEIKRFINNIIKNDEELSFNTIFSKKVSKIEEALQKFDFNIHEKIDSLLQKINIGMAQEFPNIAKSIIEKSLLDIISIHGHTDFYALIKELEKVVVIAFLNFIRSKVKEVYPSHVNQFYQFVYKLKINLIKLNDLRRLEYADIEDLFLAKILNKLEIKYYSYINAAVFEFADMNNEHIDFKPYVRYYEKVPYFKENETFIMEHLYNKSGRAGFDFSKVKDVLFDMAHEYDVNNNASKFRELDNLILDIRKKYYDILENNLPMNNKTFRILEFIFESKDINRSNFEKYQNSNNRISLFFDIVTIFNNDFNLNIRKNKEKLSINIKELIQKLNNL